MKRPYLWSQMIGTKLTLLIVVFGTSLLSTWQTGVRYYLAKRIWKGQFLERPRNYSVRRKVDSLKFQHIWGVTINNLHIPVHIILITFDFCRWSDLRYDESIPQGAILNNVAILPAVYGFPQFIIQPARKRDSGYHRYRFFCCRVVRFIKICATGVLKVGD